MAHRAGWLDQARSDLASPLDLRLVALALGRGQVNGHAMLAAGEVKSWHRVEQKTGQLLPVGRTAVFEAVARLVDRGWLLPGSRAGWESIGCLWLPPTLWTMKGRKPAHCPVHHTREATPGTESSG